MTHIALARKYRPKQFADLVGQEHVAAGLAGAVAKNRVAHAYLLTGPRGVGKTSAARILAMALNCERRETRDERRETTEESGSLVPRPSSLVSPSGEPCGACDSCTRIWSGAANLDVVEIDAASNRGVDDARDLRERAMYAASAPGGHKVYIVDEAHMLTREAWNALLKILEEPPPRVVFVFATTEPQKIANTAAPVLSRLQRFDFRRIGPQAVSERLRLVAAREQIGVEDDAIQLIARVAAGGMRDALSLLDQALVFGDGDVTAAGVRAALGLIDDDLYADLLGLIAERRTAEVFPLVARLVEAGADLSEFVNGAGDLLRALMLKVIGGEAAASEGSEPVRRAVTRYAPQFREGDVLRMLKLLAEAETVIRRSPNARLHVETLLVQWTLLDRTVELGEVLDALRGGSAAGAESREPRAAGSIRVDPPAPGSRLPAPDPPTRRPADPPNPAAAVLPPPPINAAGPLTLDALRQRWPDVIERVGQRKRVLREAVARATPTVLADGALIIDVDGAAELEGLERGRVVLAEAVAEVAGEHLLVVLRAAAAAGGAPSGAEAQRRDQRADRQERLQAYRAKDGALDAAAELLDLELTE